MRKLPALFFLFVLWPFLGKALSTPNLLSPTSGVSINSFEAMVAVGTVSQATGYQFEFDSTAGFSSLYAYRDTASVNYVYTRAFRKGIKIYWRARAFRPGDTSAWTQVFNFTLPIKMTLNSPANNSTGSVKGLMAYNMGLYAPITYLFEVDTTRSFNSPMHTLKSQNTNYFVDTPLFKFGYTLYWRASAINQYGDTLLWSDTSKYTILVNPALTGVTSSMNPLIVLSWTTADLAFTELQYDTVADFTSPALQTHLITQLYTNRDTLSNLYFSKRYYFRMRHGFGSNYSAWSATKTTLIVGAAPVSNPANGSVFGGLNPTFSWVSRTGSKTQFQLYADAGYTQLLKDTITSLSVYSYPLFLHLNSSYYTRIRFMHALDTTPWSNHFFKTYTGNVNLGSPYHQAQNQPVRLRFNFRKQIWATGHLLEIDSGSTFTGARTRFYISADSFKFDGSYYHYIDTLLGYGGRYVWRVLAIMGTDTSDPSYIQSFTTQSTPTLYFPQNGYIGIGTQTNALITGINGSEQVQWQLDTTNAFNSGELITGTDPHVPDDFQPNYVALNFPGDRLFKATYYWRARCINRLDTGGWTTPFWYTTTTDMQLLTPANGAVNVSVRPYLSWSIQGSVSDYGYQYQLSADSGFSQPQTITLTGSEVAGDSAICAFSTKYYWRARAFHSRDTSSWSAYRTFTTGPRPVIAAPLLISPLSGQLNVPLTELTLSWSFVGAASSYDVQVALDENFTQLAASGNALGTGAIFSGLEAGKRYWWRVRARKDTIVSNWSIVRWFQTVPPVGLNELTASQSLQLYPNPAKDVLNIKLAGVTSLLVYNMLGELVYEAKHPQEQQEIEVRNWPAGMYQVQCTMKDGTLVNRKVWVQHP